jgi:hypothetical protein
MNAWTYGTLTTKFCDNTTWNNKTIDQILSGLERESLAKRQGLPQGSIEFTQQTITLQNLTHSSSLRLML